MAWRRQPQIGPDGKRRRKKVSGRSKTEVRAKLAELHDELNDGVVSDVGYTLAQAIGDYLADALPGRGVSATASTSSASCQVSLPRSAVLAIGLRSCGSRLSPR